MEDQFPLTKVLQFQCAGLPNFMPIYGGCFMLVYICIPYKLYFVIQVCKNKPCIVNFQSIEVLLLCGSAHLLWSWYHTPNYMYLYCGDPYNSLCSADPCSICKHTPKWGMLVKFIAILWANTVY